MAIASPTTAISLERQVTGTNSNSWGDRTNYNWARVDAAITGISVDVSSLAVTLTAVDSGDTVADAQTRAAIIKATGTPAGAATITWPAALLKRYLLVNSTAQVVTFKVSGQTGISLAAGASSIAYCNGTDIVAEGSTFPATTFTGLITGTALTVSGIVSAATVAASGNATVGGTLGVTGAATLSSTLTVSGGAAFSGAYVTVNNPTANAEVDISLETGGLSRFYLAAFGTAGDTFGLNWCDNAGWYAGSALQVSRATGAVTIDPTGAGVNFGGAIAVPTLTASNVTLNGTVTIGSGANIGWAGLIYDSGGNSVSVRAGYGGGYAYYRFESSGSGNAYALTGSWINSSDVSLKTDVVTIPDALDLVLRMRGVYYTKISNGSRLVGVIGNEMEIVCPEATSRFEDQEGRELVGVNYGSLVAPLIEAIRVLNQKISAMELRLTVAAL